MSSRRKVLQEVSVQAGDSAHLANKSNLVTTFQIVHKQPSLDYKVQEKIIFPPESVIKN